MPVDAVLLWEGIKDRMQGETRAEWLRLCEQAAVEQDPARMLELVKQINDLLSEKQLRLSKAKTSIVKGDNLSNDIS